MKKYSIREEFHSLLTGRDLNTGENRVPSGEKLALDFLRAEYKKIELFNLPENNANLVEVTYFLGYCYFHGLGAESDIEKAIYYFRISKLTNTNYHERIYSFEKSLERAEQTIAENTRCYALLIVVFWFIPVAFFNADLISPLMTSILYFIFVGFTKPSTLLGMLRKVHRKSNQIDFYTIDDNSFFPNSILKTMRTKITHHNGGGTITFPVDKGDTNG